MRSLTFPMCMAALSLLLSSLPAPGDVIEMLNGDRYSGRVVSMDGEHVVIQNEVLGKVSLPRKQAALISVGPKADSSVLTTRSGTNVSHVASSVEPVLSQSEFEKQLRSMQTNSPMVQQVQKQFLADAGPEANQKFNEMLSGVLSGKISVADLRSQAKQAAEQLRTFKKDLGEDSGFALDAYLSILDNFLQQTGSDKPKAETRSNAATTSSRTNAPAVKGGGSGAPL